MKNFPQKNVVRVNIEKHPGVPVNRTWWTSQDEVDVKEQQDNGTCDSL